MENCYFQEVWKTIVIYILRSEQKSAFFDKIKPIRIKNRIINEKIIYKIKIIFKKIKKVN